MGTCTLENATSYKLSRDGVFVIKIKNPSKMQNIFPIYFEFEQNLLTSYTLESQSQTQTQSQSEENCYKISLRKQDCKLDTTLDVIGLQIQNAFEKANRLGMNKIVFVEPQCQSGTNKKIVYAQIIRMVFQFDQTNKYSTTNQIYANWPSIDCKKNIQDTIKSLKAIS